MGFADFKVLERTTEQQIKLLERKGVNEEYLFEHLIGTNRLPGKSPVSAKVLKFPAVQLGVDWITYQAGIKCLWTPQR